MKFVSNYLVGGIVQSKTKCDALVTIAKLMDYPDYKIYWKGNTPYMLPFAQSRRVFEVYASYSKMGKALLVEHRRYAV
jgi:hypothetical protein